MSKKLIDTHKVVTGLVPADISGAAANADYICLKNFDRVSIIIAMGTSGNAAAVTLTQATEVAGTTTKALAFTEVFANVATGTSDTLVRTTVTANTFNTDASVNNLYVIEVKADSLDVSNSYDCLRVNIANPGGASVTHILYIMGGPRYASSLAVSAITD